MSGHPTAPLHENCQNCGRRLDGPWCSACGQKDFDFHQSFGHLVHEALETWFHVDGSFLRGFYHLLFEPGLMSREFNEGKRARHVPPLRFYLVISLVFFLVMVPHEIERDDVLVVDDPPAGVRIENSVTTERPPFAISRSDADLPLVGPETEAALAEEIERKFQRPEEVVLAFLGALPKTLLFCLPLFALLTRIAYRRSGFVYLQHLIVSVHLHTFVFLWWMVAEGWILLADLVSGIAATWLGVAAVVYAFYAYYAALRRSFGGSRKMTLLKGTLVGAAYLLLLVLAMGATFLVTVLV